MLTLMLFRWFGGWSSGWFWWIFTWFLKNNDVQYSGTVDNVNCFGDVRIIKFSIVQPNINLQSINWHRVNTSTIHYHPSTKIGEQIHQIQWHSSKVILSHKSWRNILYPKKNCTKIAGCFETWKKWKTQVDSRYTIQMNSNDWTSLQLQDCSPSPGKFFHLEPSIADPSPALSRADLSDGFV